MSVLIAMICREIARFSECFASVMGLEMPPGTEYFQWRGYNTPMGWNMAVRRLLESDHEYLFTTNDDHLYPKDSLSRLLARKVECVSGLYLLRQYPFEPVVYDLLAENGAMDHYYLEDGVSGMKKMLVVPDGCLLTHRSVYEKIEKDHPELMPWYQLNGPPAPPDQINCDVLFSGKVRAAGFDIWCDLDVRVAHIMLAPIWPQLRPDGKWQTVLGQGNGQGIGLAKAEPGARAAAEAIAVREAVRARAAEKGQL